MTGDGNRCDFVTKKPKRRPINIPEDIKEGYEFLTDYKYRERERIYPKTQAPVSSVNPIDAAIRAATSLEAEASTTKLDPKKPLKGHKIAVIGKFQTNVKDIKAKVTELGAKPVTTIDRTTLFAVSTTKEIEKRSEKIEDAEAKSIIVVEESILDDLETSLEEKDIPEVIRKHGISEWGIEQVETRFKNLLNTSRVKSFKSGECFQHFLFIEHLLGNSLPPKHRSFYAWSLLHLDEELNWCIVFDKSAHQFSPQCWRI